MDGSGSYRPFIYGFLLSYSIFYMVGFYQGRADAMAAREQAEAGRATQSTRAIE